MSRQPRAGTAGKPVTIRATVSERALWEQAATATGCRSLSAWIVKTLNKRAERITKYNETVIPPRRQK
jgi:uncharacterized protein (DUF1778 family)